MQVQLLNYTGIGTNSPAEFAARLLVDVKNTRISVDAAKLSQEALNKELFAIALSIRSSWEFIEYHWHVNWITRACLDQIARTRMGSYAAQAMRVADMTGFEARKPNAVAAHEDAALSWDAAIRFIRGAYQDLRGDGISAQDARGILPMNTLTGIHVKWNLRTFADVVGKRENLRVQDEYIEVVQAMKKTALEVHPWIGPFLNPERNQTPALDVILRDALGGSSPVDKPQVNQALKELDRLKGIWG